MLCFLLLMLVGGQVWGQLGTKGLTPSQLYQAAMGKKVPYPDDFFRELLAMRDHLDDIGSNPSASLYGTIKLASHKFKFQSLIHAHLLAVNKMDEESRSQLFQDYRTFYRFETTNERWQQEQRMAQMKMNSLITDNWDQHVKAQITDEFFTFPEHEEWFYVSICQFLNDAEGLDSTTVHHYDSLKTAFGKSLEAQGRKPEPLCSSVYAQQNCESLAKQLAERNKRQRIIEENQRREEERKQQVAEERKTRYEAERERGAPIMARAQELMDQGELLEARAIYQEMRSSSVYGNQSRQRIRKISSMLYAQKKDSIRQVIYDTYLYDTLGQLRIDTTYRLSPSELYHLKDHRVQISTRIIELLRAHDKKLLDRYHRGVYTFPEYRKTLPFIITAPTSHLYTIHTDSQSITQMEHRQLSGDSINGQRTDSLLQGVVRKLFPLLKMEDGQPHVFYLPITYIPQRHQTNWGHYLNCHTMGGYSKLECLDQLDFFKGAGPIAGVNSKHDPFFFVVTEGKTPGPHPPTPPIIQPRIEEIKPIQLKRFLFWKYYVDSNNQRIKVKTRNRKADTES